MSTVKIINPATNQPFASAYTGVGAGFGGQLRGWDPQPRTADAALLPGLERANARADDLVRNHGIAHGGVNMHIDNIVGHLFRLSAKPRWKRLGISEADARAFAADVEAAWNELAEDPVGCYLDAERKRTFTMMIREGVGCHTTRGEIMAYADWIGDRPANLLKTAIKVVSPLRVSNPQGHANTKEIHSGVRIDARGAAVGYFVRDLEETAWGVGNGFGSSWREIPRETPWGRQEFLHVFEPADDGQTRGANKFLSVMEQVHMLSKLQNTKLQNAIVNAMYAATIESELGSEAALELIAGASTDTSEAAQQTLQNYLALTADYHGSMNIRMNGVKIPHLMPGERLNLQTSANSDNGFADLEAAILRYIAAGIGVSYEQLSRDYSKVNYSSGRLSMMENWRHFMGKRKVIASRYATMIYALVLEELIDRKWVTLPRGARFDFYQAKAAWCNAEWIGQGRIAIDGLKEVKEAVLRIEAGLSTYEKELAIMGEDYQEVFAQQLREMQERREAGLPPPSWMRTQALAPDDEQTEEEAA